VRQSSTPEAVAGLLQAQIELLLLRTINRLDDRTSTGARLIAGLALVTAVAALIALQPDPLATAIAVVLTPLAVYGGLRLVDRVRRR
jgi:hypothetical protein